MPSEALLCRCLAMRGLAFAEQCEAELRFALPSPSNALPSPCAALRGYAVALQCAAYAPQIPNSNRP